MQTLQALETFDEFSPIDGMDATTARQLIDANRWYQMSNNASLDKLHRMQSRDKAAELLDTILARLPFSADALNLKGRLALDEGNLQEARELIEAAIRQHPEKASYWSNRGFVSLLQKEFDQAEAFFDRALAYDNSNVQAFSSIALCHYLKNDYLGAFLRYRSLMKKGVLNQAGQSILAECCAQLTADSYDQELENDLLHLFSLDEFQHVKLGNLASSLIKAKYDLGNEDCTLDIDTLAKDQLLLSLLATGCIHNTQVEELITLLRQHIVIEVSQTGALRDDLQKLAIGLGLLGEQTDYLLTATAEETLFIEDLDQCIRNTLQTNWHPADIIGALIIVSMYKQLYAQNYSYKLLTMDLSDWPTGLQPLLEKNLYIKCDLHAIRFSLPHRDATLARGFDSPYAFSAYPKWQQLPYNSRSSYARALSEEVGYQNVPNSLWHNATCLLIIGCESGERAIRLARSFDNIHIIALDKNEENVAYGIYQARQLGLTNIEFNVFDKASDIQDIECCFDIIEIHAAHCDDIALIHAAKRILDSQGLIRIGLKQTAPELEQVINQLQQVHRVATAENVRQMRLEVLQLIASTPNHPISQQSWFYSLAGCKQMLFRKDRNSKAQIATILNETGLVAISDIEAGNEGEQLKVYSKVKSA
ncbi:MAG: hypothetical protein CSA50_07655 [Gammaproteobacteria bacterium]|nr:MAG: hypothetical protein CSA50_07655 [Gammaproteobacteria bacterium]